MTSDVQFQIYLLIGADHYWDIVEDDIIRSLGPTAAKSKIDYLLSGPVLNPSPTSSAFDARILKVSVLNESENILNTALERFGNLESIRIHSTQAGTNKGQLVTEYHTSSIRLPSGQYFAKLPLKVDHAPLPANESIARGRKRISIRRLCKEPHKLTAYHAIIHQQLKRGFIEEVSNPRITTGHA